MKHSASHIKTVRLWLREIDESDTETIVKLRSDPDYYRFFMQPHSITADEHTDWYWNEYVEDSKRIDWIAIDDKDGKVIGLFGLRQIGSKRAEVSYLLSRDARGNGYAAEAVNGIMDHAAANWDINFMTAEIHKDNKDSLRFIEKMAFERIRENGDFLIYGRRL